MYLIRSFFLIIAFTSFAQESITAKFISKQNLEVDHLIDIDNFDILYYIKGNTFYKKTKDRLLNYSNVQFGEITSATAFNTLKPTLFFKDFNTVMILDNRLSEMVRIEFNNHIPFRSITHVSTANDNAIWIFNQNTQQLELFDYKSQKTKIKTLPISSPILDIESNYNYCWLLTKQFIFIYNYTGSLLRKIPNNGYECFEENNGKLYLLKANNLFLLPKDSDNILPIILPELLINQFLVTNETLYIYNNEILYQYQLKTD